MNDESRIPPDGGNLIPEDRAQAALRRAAQLQAEAVERRERLARTEIEAQVVAEQESSGLRREDLEAVAAEAGISPEYLRHALLEQDALGTDAAELAPWVDRMGTRLLRSRQRSLEVSRAFDADAATVLRAMQQVFPSQPYLLTLEDVIGGAPLEGGTLVFRLAGLFSLPSGTTIPPFGYAAYSIGLQRLQASLHPVAVGERSGCVVTLRADLRTGTRHNVWASLVLSGMGGAVGAAGAAFAAVAAGAIVPLVAAAGVAGLAAFGAASARGYGAVYVTYVRKMEEQLHVLLKSVDTHVRTGGGFRPPTLPSARPFLPRELPPAD